MITTSMPLTSAYSHQNISDEMNIYVHQEIKSTNGNLKLGSLYLLYYRNSVFGTLFLKINVFQFNMVLFLKYY